MYCVEDGDSTFKCYFVSVHCVEYGNSAFKCNVCVSVQGDSPFNCQFVPVYSVADDSSTFKYLFVVEYKVVALSSVNLVWAEFYFQTITNKQNKNRWRLSLGLKMWIYCSDLCRKCWHTFMCEFLSVYSVEDGYFNVELYHWAWWQHLSCTVLLVCCIGNSDGSTSIC